MHELLIDWTIIGRMLRQQVGGVDFQGARQSKKLMESHSLLTRFDVCQS